MKSYSLGFDGYPCPRENLLGGKEGQGFYQLMATYEYARIQTAARAVGTAQAAYEAALKYAQERIQFGKPIADFQVIRHKLAHAATEIEAARQLTYYACEKKDSGKRSDLEAGMAKVFAAEMAERVTSEMMQVFGGYGYSREYPAQRFWRDARVFRIFEGTSEIQYEVIAKRLSGANDLARIAIRTAAQRLRGARPTSIRGTSPSTAAWWRCSRRRFWTRRRSIRRHLSRTCGLQGSAAASAALLNLALSFSVHDVSEQAIAHLAYIDVRFPEAGYVGDTVRARSTVIDVKPASSGDKGVVHVRTALANERGHVLCAFERKALIRAGKLAERPAWANASGAATPDVKGFPSVPKALRDSGKGGFGPYANDFEVGQVFMHAIGKTIGESEHMQLTALVRNSHPLHFDEVYCKDNSFTKQRVVYGGLVLSWVATLASRDLGGQRAVGSRARRGRASQRRRRRRHALRRVESHRRRRRQGHLPPRRRQESHVRLGVRRVRRRALRRRAGEEGRQDQRQGRRDHSHASRSKEIGNVELRSAGHRPRLRVRRTELTCPAHSLEDDGQGRRLRRRRSDPRSGGRLRGLPEGRRAHDADRGAEHARLQGKLRAFRPNDVRTTFCYRDVIEVVEAAGENIDAW